MRIRWWRVPTFYAIVAEAQHALRGPSGALTEGPAESFNSWLCVIPFAFEGLPSG